LQDDPPVLPLIRTRLQYLDVVFADGHCFRNGERSFGGVGLLTSEKGKKWNSAASSSLSVF
ncbi:hypothetical protein SLA2020_148440, partial [Shorea laevis]